VFDMFSSPARTGEDAVVQVRWDVAIRAARRLALDGSRLASSYEEDHVRHHPAGHAQKDETDDNAAGDSR